jgi:hypothetical protein
MPGWKQARAAFIIRDDALVVFVFVRTVIVRCLRSQNFAFAFALLFLFRFMQAEVRLCVRRAAVVVFLREVVTTYLGVASFLALLKIVL